MSTTQNTSMKTTTAVFLLCLVTLITLALIGYGDYKIQMRKLDIDEKRQAPLILIPEISEQMPETSNI